MLTFKEWQAKQSESTANKRASRQTFVLGLGPARPPQSANMCSPADVYGAMTQDRKEHKKKHKKKKD